MSRKKFDIHAAKWHQKEFDGEYIPKKRERHQNRIAKEQFQLKALHKKISKIQFLKLFSEKDTFAYKKVKFQHIFSIKECVFSLQKEIKTNRWELWAYNKKYQQYFGCDDYWFYSERAGYKHYWNVTFDNQHIQVEPKTPNTDSINIFLDEGSRFKSIVKNIEVLSDLNKFLLRYINSLQENDAEEKIRTFEDIS
jgi:hypothetical protein